MGCQRSYFLLFLCLIWYWNFILIGAKRDHKTSIIFATQGRSYYSFDLYGIPISDDDINIGDGDEFLLTDGVSVNFNGNFPSDPAHLLSLFFPDSIPSLDEVLPFVYVTERNGTSAIFLDAIPSFLLLPKARRTVFELPRTRFQFSLVPGSIPVASMRDRPTVSGEYLVYVSTHEPETVPRLSWAAVYSTHIPSGETHRLTPHGVADFSPAVSPSGLWTAVASGSWGGEIQELNTSIYIFRTSDGSRRRLLVEHGGWPCWVDERTVIFHRCSSDGWWSIFRVTITSDNSIASLIRITPPGSHYFTPASIPGSPEMVVAATRKSNSVFRHIELIDFSSIGYNTNYIEITKPKNPNVHHYNPFVSSDATIIGYHRCRGHAGHENRPLLLENIVSPVPKSLSLFRIDGSFPSFSPDGALIAYTDSDSLYVMNSDGSEEPKEVLNGTCFATAWDWKRRGVIYTSHGPIFSSETSRVDIISISLGENGRKHAISMKQLTAGGGNNGFPSPSPDGKRVVFRSGRSGHKNLYIMDAVRGETAGIQRLTKGAWTDTMCVWSPDGEWIAFASDRHNPGGGSFAIYIIHPNGTGVHRVVHSGDGGRANHPWFSPDSKNLAFTSDYAGLSAEPIGSPHQYLPSGDIFTVKIDGTNTRRLTHNSYDDGTPTWAPIYLKPVDVAKHSHDSPICGFDDCHWLV